MSDRCINGDLLPRPVKASLIEDLIEHKHEDYVSKTRTMSQRATALYFETVTLSRKSSPYYSSDVDIMVRRALAGNGRYFSSKSMLSVTTAEVLTTGETNFSSAPRVSHGKWREVVSSTSTAAATFVDFMTDWERAVSRPTITTETGIDKMTALLTDSPIFIPLNVTDVKHLEAGSSSSMIPLQKTATYISGMLARSLEANADRIGATMSLSVYDESTEISQTSRLGRLILAMLSATDYGVKATMPERDWITIVPTSSAKPILHTITQK